MDGSMTPDKPNTTTGDSAADMDLLKVARERYEAGELYDRDNRQEDLNDRKFLAGEQYPPEVILERRGRPCEVYNRLPQFVKQVTGEMRQNNPEIRVLPKDDQASKEVADIYNAIIQHIENLSDAKRVYTKAGENAVQGGIGFFRILTDFVDDNSFDQDIIIRHIRNPLSVVMDPDAHEATRRDMAWCFVSELISTKVFKAAYPNIGIDDFESLNTSDQSPTWRNGDFIRVAEYWTRTRDGNKTLAYCSDGSTREVDKTAKAGETLPLDSGAVQIVQTREVPRYVVKWYRMTGTAVIDRGDWLGSTIPIIPVIGEEIAVGDRVVRSGLIRHAKGSQRTYNYFRNAAVEHIALQPKAPYIATAKQIKPYKDMWDNSNIANTPYLLYDVDPQAAGKPERQAPPTMPAAMYQEAQVADGDMKATTGIYDASLGQRSNETSGKAIIARQEEGNTATFVYIDNRSAAIEAAGKILIDLIPEIYTTERAIRLVGPDGKVEGFAKINARGPDGRLMNDLSVGSYDVTVTTGPAYASRRQQAADSMMQFVQAAPNTMPLIADLIATNMDWPGAEKISDRLRHALPAGIDPEADAEKAKAQANMPPNPAAQMAQQMQQEAAQIELQLKDFEAGKAKETERLTAAQADGAEVDAEIKRVQLAQMTGQTAVLVEQGVQARLQEIIAGFGAQGEGPSEPYHPGEQAEMEPQQMPEQPGEQMQPDMGAAEQQPQMAGEGQPGDL